MMYGDILAASNIYPNVIKKFKESKVEGLISLVEVDNPQDYGIISLDLKGFVKNIIEKPSTELNFGNLANAGIFIFNSLIFEAIEKTIISSRGEYELTDSMDILIKKLNGKIIGYIIKKHFWSDIGLPWQFLDANCYLLDHIEQKILVLCNEFSERLQSNEEIFTAFYINDLNNFEEGDRERIIKND